MAQSRAYLDALQIPVWAGQISQRAGFQSTLAAGASAAEIGPNTAAGVEIASAVARGRALDRGDQRGAASTPGAPANGDEDLIGTQAA